MKALLTIGGGQALVKGATTSDDAERSRPAPDILVAALEKSGASPDRAIMIGDTPYDIEARPAVPGSVWQAIQIVAGH